MLGKIINTDNVFLLTELLRDNDSSVKKEAIAVALKVKRPETWPILIELLSVAGYTHAAANALIESGDAALPVLEVAFHKSGQSIQMLQKIISIYGQIGTPRSSALLWDKIEYPDAKVTTEVLLALNVCRQHAGSSKFAVVQQLIEQEIGKAAWNQAALLEIADAPYNLYLKQALEEEMRYNFERIFLLLSLVYDSRSIQLVKENIESGTGESKVYALELLDVFIDKHLKSILFPLLDDIPADEEVSIYQAYFPRETLGSTEVLLHLLNREYYALNRWTRTCAIYSLLMTPHVQISNELIAHIFNTDPILRETAAWAIYRLDSNFYDELGKRLKTSVKRELDHTLKNLSMSSSDNALASLFMERILFLKRTFLLSHLPTYVLADIAEVMNTLFFRKGESIIRTGDQGNIPVYIIANGTAKCLQQHSYIDKDNRLAEGDLIGENFILDSDNCTYEVVAAEDLWVYAIEKETIYRLISYYPEIGPVYAQIAAGLVPEESLLTEQLQAINA